MERRLAAVLIADVVGYGRLSQIDEEGTRTRFQADLKDIFEPKIATSLADKKFLSPQNIVDHLIECERRHRGHARQADDLTILAGGLA